MTLKSLIPLIGLTLLTHMASANKKQEYCIDQPMFMVIIKSAMSEALNGTSSDGLFLAKDNTQSSIPIVICLEVDEEDTDTSQMQWLSDPSIITKFIKFSDAIQSYAEKFRNHSSVPDLQPSRERQDPSLFILFMKFRPRAFSGSNTITPNRPCLFNPCDLERHIPWSLLFDWCSSVCILLLETPWRS